MVGNGAKDPNIASLDEARRRKAEQDRAAKRAARVVTTGTIGQRVFGGMAIAVAVAYLAWLVGGLGGTAAPNATSIEATP